MSPRPISPRFSPTHKTSVSDPKQSPSPEPESPPPDFRRRSTFGPLDGLSLRSRSSSSLGGQPSSGRGRNIQRSSTDGMARDNASPVPGTSSYLRSTDASRSKEVGAVRRNSEPDIEQQRVRAKVAKEFIAGPHIEAIAQACRQWNFAVSFRASGELTLKRLAEGAAAKGHDIDPSEKTIKPASLLKAYESQAETVMQQLHEADIDGYVGHWEGKRLVGIYLSHRARQLPELEGHLNDKDKGIYPIDMNDLSGSLKRLKSIPQWKTLPVSGDYDMHDLIYLGSHAHLVPDSSFDEKRFIDALNAAVAKVDPQRPFIEYDGKNPESDRSLVRHGPQVNFIAHMMSVEKTPSFSGTVARPGGFPLAMCNRGTWSIIQTETELQAFYKTNGATMKRTWTDPNLLKPLDPKGGDDLVTLDKGRRRSGG